jgi:hypothetical protein
MRGRNKGRRKGEKCWIKLRKTERETKKNRKKAIKEEEGGINEKIRVKRKGKRRIEDIKGKEEERTYEIGKIRNKERTTMEEMRK